MLIAFLTFRKEHRSLSEELQHLKDSLLRDTNRDMDQQRVIEKMKAERRETICIQAQQRQGLEKDLHSAETKVGCGVWLPRSLSFVCSWIV